MGGIRDIDKGMIDISKFFKSLKKTKINVGIFSDAINNEDGKSEYVADYAIANEYGKGHIPERSFIRTTANEKQEEWAQHMQSALTDVSRCDKASVKKRLYRIGSIVRSDIVRKIDSNINPPNAPATLKQKGLLKNKTLIDHGVLRTSIEARINKG